VKGEAAGRREGARRDRRIEASDQITEGASTGPVRKICECRLLDNSSISKKASRQLADERDPLRSKGSGKGRSAGVKPYKQIFQLDGFELSSTPVYLHTHHERP
jgi:hypothetical protein